MWIESFEFFSGAVMAYMITRIPFLTFPRVKSWNEQFPPHPEPVYVDAHLVQRVLHMRVFYWLALVFAIIPLTFGWVSLAHGSAPFGFGLWTVSGWLVLSRVTGFFAGEEAPCTKQMAMRLQQVRNVSDSDDSCCAFSQPMWEVTCVRCKACGKVLLNEPRPDLGRPRSDGWIMGFVRLVLTDGKPIMAGDEEE
jgi:hypothetical protein